MKLEITLRTIADDSTVALLKKILESVETLTREMRAERKAMSAELDRLKAAVEKNTEVDQSAVTLLNGLAQQIRDMKDDPAKLAELADSLEARNAELAEAVTTNTPAEPNP